MTAKQGRTSRKRLTVSGTNGMASVIGHLTACRSSASWAQNYASTPALHRSIRLEPFEIPRWLFPFAPCFTSYREPLSPKRKEERKHAGPQIRM